MVPIGHYFTSSTTFLKNKELVPGYGNASAVGRRVGGPRVIVDASKIASLRARGDLWSQIQTEPGVSKGTAQRVFAARMIRFAHRTAADGELLCPWGWSDCQTDRPWFPSPQCTHAAAPG